MNNIILAVTADKDIEPAEDLLAFLYATGEKQNPEDYVMNQEGDAITTVNQIDMLLSWNFKHLANINKQLAVKVINEHEGYYYPMLLTNPMEVLYEDD